MNLSAVLVVARKDALLAVRERLFGLQGVDVHHVDAAGGRLIITLEASSVDDAVDLMRQVQATDGVLSASLVQQVFGDDDLEESLR